MARKSRRQAGAPAGLVSASLYNGPALSDEEFAAACERLSLTPEEGAALPGRYWLTLREDLDLVLRLYLAHLISDATGPTEREVAAELQKLSIHSSELSNNCLALTKPVIDDEAYKKAPEE